MDKIRAAAFPIVLFPLAFFLAPAASSAPVEAARSGTAAMAVTFDKALYGDFVLVGNGVTTCPAEPSCVDAQERKGSGPSAQNNTYAMDWADVDTDPATFNSSSARLTVPAGARVAYAKLSWAGNAGSTDEAACGGRRPPKSPKTQAVSLALDDRAAQQIGPDRFTVTEDDPARGGPADQVFYSASADVSAELNQAKTGSPSTVTVGNVWTPQGHDCFGGWSLAVVWAFDGPTAGKAPSKKHVVVYDGHVRVLVDTARLTLTTPVLRPAGGTVRIGVTAYEGDWASGATDQFLVNGSAQADPSTPGDTGNFFGSSASGRLKPDHPNNMSVDAKTVEVSDKVVEPGEQATEFAFTSTGDAYLVSGLVVSAPLPELAVTTGTDRPVARPGDETNQTVRVTNTGGAPAVDVVVRTDAGPSCDRRFGRIEPAATVTVSCTRTAREDDYREKATATAGSLAGDKLAAEASAAVDVIHPRIAATMTAAPELVLSGQQVRYEISVANPGDTPLSAVSVDGTEVDACDRADLGVLAPGQSVAASCSVNAGEDGFTAAIAVRGKDSLGVPVDTTARAAFSVVHPYIAMELVPSTNSVRDGSPVSLTVSVSNPSPIPLSDVHVDGTPAACERRLGTLAPDQTVTYTCAVDVAGRLDAGLAVFGTPVIGGSPVEDRADSVRGTASVIVSTIPVVPAAASVVPERAEPERPVVVARVGKMAGQTPSPAPPALFVAGLATLTMFVTVGAVTAARKP
jgi:uncharacterized repeat protein (TIGR01451 family)